MSNADQQIAPIIYIDADACPVKDEVLKVAERHGLVVTLVSNGGMRPSRDPMIRNVIVPKNADAADDWIVEAAVKNDIVITADILLAERCVSNFVRVIGPTGREFTQESIGMQVAMRDLNQSLRESGEIKGYNKAFSAKDRSNFLQTLEASVRLAKAQVS
ncbi:MAG: YaiI/YqxD family protein [Nitratireductor sp.]